MTASLRVLHVVQPVDGGAARVVLQLADDQRRRGWEVVVACPDGGTLSDELAGLGIARTRWDARRSAAAGTPAQVRALAGIVRAAVPELVHLHSASAGMTGRLAVRGRLPTVFQPHGWSWQAVTGPVERATVRWERLAQRWSDAIVCVSADEADAGARRGVTRGVVVVPNGVDLGAFPDRDGAGRQRARARLGLAPVPTAVCVGRLSEQKGQADLVACWPLVLEQVPEAVLVLVGDGPSRSALATQVAELGLHDAVLIVGARPDVVDWYAAADVVAFSSRHGEAMALTPLEAQAAARSLVATDVAGVGSSLGPGAGVVVPPGDVPALARALAARLSDPVRTDAEGRAGREHAERALTVARTADLVAALSRAVADGRPPGDAQPR